MIEDRAVDAMHVVEIEFYLLRRMLRTSGIVDYALSK